MWKHASNFTFIVALTAALTTTTACKKDSAEGGSASASAAPKATGPCAGAGEALSGIAILEVKESPDDAKKGAELVDQLRSELTSTCVEKGYDKSAVEALGCYEKNKGKAGYRVLKDCDDKPGKDIVAAVVAKHGGKRTD
ncbi:MAG: hypothetical protein U0271_22810 [Polyangiaceae bacterium]